MFELQTNITQKKKQCNNFPLQMVSQLCVFIILPVFLFFFRFQFFILCYLAYANLLRFLYGTIIMF